MKKKQFSMNRICKRYAWLCLLFLSSHLLAQHTGKRKIINLHSTGQLNNTGNVSSITIVRNLPDSTFLGVVPSTEQNVRANIGVSGNGVQSWLQIYVQQQFGTSYKQRGASIQWVINELSVGTDSSSTGVISFTKLNADIYTAVSNDNYQLTGNFDTLIVNNNLNPDFGQSIADALNALYNNTIPSTEQINNVNGGVADITNYNTNKTATQLLQSIKAKILNDSFIPDGNLHFF